MPHFQELITGEYNYKPVRPQPRVTVLLTTYNRAKLLKRAIDSVRAQTFTDWQLIILDDGSPEHPTDADSIDIGVPAMLSDQRIIYRYLPHSGIPSVSLNVGLRDYRSDYIAWLCDDDIWAPTMLASLVAFMDANPFHVGVYCDAAGPAPMIKHDGWILEKLMERNFIPGTMLWREEFSPVFREEPEFRGYEDWMAWIDIASFGQIGYIPFKLREQYPTPGSISLSTPLVDHFKAVAKVHNYYGQYRWARAARSDAFWARFPAPWRYPFAWLSREICLRMFGH